MRLDEALPFDDLNGNSWFTCTQPYAGLATRTRISEQAWWSPRGSEYLITARLVREHSGGPGATRHRERAQRAGAQPARPRAVRPRRHGGARAAVAAHRHQGLHVDPAHQVGAILRRPAPPDARDRRCRRRPAQPAHHRAARRRPHRCRPAHAAARPGAARRARPARAHQHVRRSRRAVRDHHRRATSTSSGATTTASSRSSRTWSRTPRVTVSGSSSCWCRTRAEPGRRQPGDPRQRSGHPRGDAPAGVQPVLACRPGRRQRAGHVHRARHRRAARRPHRHPRLRRRRRADPGLVPDQRAGGPHRSTSATGP